MKTILDEIVENRRKEIEEQKQRVNFKELEQMLDLSIPTNSLSGSLKNSNASSIIAEFKRKSPSKGVINDMATPAKVVKGYADAGASGVSILTETKYFGGANEDLKAVKKENSAIPLLRKDFTVDTYQIMEARAIGADVILLIASVLSSYDISMFTAFAHELGLEVLLEIHDESEIDKIDPNVDMLVVNKRNLKDCTKRTTHFKYI